MRHACVVRLSRTHALRPCTNQCVVPIRVGSRVWSTGAPLDPPLGVDYASCTRCEYMYLHQYLLVFCVPWRPCTSQYSKAFRTKLSCATRTTSEKRVHARTASEDRSRGGTRDRPTTGQSIYLPLPTPAKELIRGRGGVRAAVPSFATTSTIGSKSPASNPRVCPSPWVCPWHHSPWIHHWVKPLVFPWAHPCVQP